MTNPNTQAREHGEKDRVRKVGTYMDLTTDMSSCMGSLSTAPMVKIASWGRL